MKNHVHEAERNANRFFVFSSFLRTNDKVSVIYGTSSKDTRKREEAP